jgi:gliding motility-associated-like protein
MLSISVSAKSVKYNVLVLIALFLTKTGMTQLCTGSLGDPVVNITFGSGSNPGKPLPSASTNYSFTSSSCPDDGSYTVVNSSTGCFSNSWHSVTEDHTPGDVNGYMMLVNASFTPGVFYLDTVKNLCGGTTYEFSAWLLNILKSSACSGAGIMPNITFSIETTTGTIIQTYNTGFISTLSSPQWKQYGFFFTLPSGVSDLVLRMTNNAPGGCGNDIALDDITFRPCGPKVDVLFANISGAADTTNFCISDNKSITLNGSVQAGFNNPALQWQQSTDNGATWTDIAGAVTNNYTQVFSVAGSFRYRLSVAEAGNIAIARCRVASNALTIIIDAIPIPQAASSSPVCIGASLILTAKDGGQYVWTGPNGFSSAMASPTIDSVKLTDAGKYYVQVKTNGGCNNIDSTIVAVKPLPAADAGPYTIICENTSTVLQAGGGSSYLWTPATGLSNAAIADPVASPLITTLYTVKVTSPFNCTASDTVTIAVLKKPVANAGPDKRITEGAAVQLDGTAGGDTAISYSWTPAQFINNTSILTPVVNPVNDFIYTLHVQSGNGCGSASDDVFVRVFKKINIPNAFSPNGDGINDVWNIQALETYPESTTEVFNRYGQPLFRSKGYAKPWDGNYNGRPLPFGTYYYIIDRKNGFPLLSGWVMIIR